jgi:hypothetical protein
VFEAQHAQDFQCPRRLVATRRLARRQRHPCFPAQTLTICRGVARQPRS